MLCKIPTNTLSADLLIATVRAHFAEHGAALCNAAALIENEHGAARVLRLMSDLRKATHLDRTLRNKLIDLHRLLSLDIALGNLEAELPNWIMLDPADVAPCS
ncbi:hypothetical protein P775_17850 [Puniceibacterium antarcticum]|uniref:Uncharacterized protein n=1 Tax=Puniceibacterium antarcticum TaxID=1206336 RepID=A0A2G8RBF4_9RHOB|nr:hypothetical protein P775_17850 [Puniceibacterium antarcticum]